MRAALIPALLLLSACGQEPDFDERYDAAEQEIREKAAAMQAELDERQQAAEEPEETPAAD